MHIRNRLKSALAVALIAGGVTAVAASSASALVTETDADVLIDGAGYDGGGSGWTGSAPANPGTVEWDQAWFGVVPSFVGRIHLFHVATDCGRVRLISYDSSGAELGRVYSTTRCAPDNDHYSWPVDIQGSAGAPEVLVTVQSQNSTGWANVGSVRRYYGPTIDTDDVQINRATFDFGTGLFTGGNPASPGTMTWTTSGSGITEPRLEGTLYINDTTECARMRLKYYSILGGLLETRYGGTVCGVNDELRKYHVDLAPYASAMIDEVQVSIQHFDASPPPGAWATVGSTRAYLN